MRIVSLASGSGGNAYAVEGGGATLLIDCGLAYFALVKRALAAGVNLDALCGVLFTHEHTDHVRGADVFRKKRPGVPFFANLMTAEAIERSLTGAANFLCFEPGQPFAAGPFAVEAFPVPHDVCDPVGFLVRCGGVTYFHATDIGAPLASIGAKFAAADLATLESNHDAQLLRMSARPQSLKSRISGPRGHLSNDDAAALAAAYASTRLKYLALAHLSSECNAPHIAERTMRDALQRAGKHAVALEILSQDTPSKGWIC